MSIKKIGYDNEKKFHGKIKSSIAIYGSCAGLKSRVISQQTQCYTALKNCQAIYNVLKEIRSCV